jgi:hypothetical protein
MHEDLLGKESGNIVAMEIWLKQAKFRRMYSEYEWNVLLPAFWKNKETLVINKNKQNRHIVGSKEFAYFNVKSQKEGKIGYSYFYPHIDIMEILPRIIGTGILEFENGKPKRETVKCSYNIGVGGRIGLVVTDVLSIRYSTTGVHAFPIHPNVYDDIVNRLKKKNRQARFTASCRSVLIGFISNIQSFFEKVKRIMRKK